MKQSNFSLSTALSVFNVLFDDIANLGMNLLRNDYTVLWANRGMAALVQRPVSEMIGRPCYQAFRGRDEPCEVCLLEIISSTRQPWVGERTGGLPGKERQYAEVRAYPILDSEGQVEFLFEILSLLTKKKKEEERRKRYVGSLERTLGQLTTATVETPQRARAQGLGALLTARETEVLRLVAKGFSNKEIASILGMSPDTAKTHLKNVFHKLDVTDRAEAAVWASVNDLV